MEEYGVFDVGGGKFAVYKMDAQGEAAGDPVGTFNSADEAKAKCDELNAAKAQPAAAATPPATGAPVKPTRMKATVEDRLAKVETENAALKARLGAPAVATGGYAQPRDPTPPFETLGHQLKAVIDIERDPGAASQTQRNKLLAVKDIPAVKSLGITESVISDGGALLQPTFASALFDRVYDENNIISKTQKQTVGPNSNSYVVKQIDETSRATGSRYGGISVVRVPAGGTISASRPRFTTKELPLRKLVAACYAENEALEDITQLESEINRLFPLEFNFVIQNELFNGDGASQMLGVFRSPARASVLKLVGQDAATVKYENIMAMWSRMWAASRGNAEWYINQDIESQLYTMEFPMGTGGVPVFLPPGGVSEKPYATMFGRPIIPVEQASTLGTEGDVSLIDWSQYLTVSKGGIKNDVSIHVAFMTDETTFRFTARNNGAPLWASALTPATGSANTLSPYVTLETRS